MSPVSRAPAAEPIPAIQQEIARLAALPGVQSAMEWFRDQEGQFTRWQLEVARIAAPPFGEQARSDWLTEKFSAVGLRCIQQDNLGNVFGSQSAIGDPCVSVSAHLDTVFPAGTVLDARQQGQKLYGPSVSDNSAGITALLAVAAAVVRFRLSADGLSPASSLLFIGNVGEEGEGDLRGMRYIFSDSQWKDAITASVVVDGAGTDTVVAEALGSRRFEVILRGPGGHSWSDFGAPNPVVAMARAIQLFSQTQVSSSPKTTFNIGVIHGGTSVNSIPESATMRVDIRSTSALEIERLELELRSAVEHAIEAEEIRASASHGSPSGSIEAKIVAIGNRPAGELPPNARILQITRAVDAHLGNTAHVQRASTDANIPISLGREAIAIGAGGVGGGAHTLHEWFDTAGRELGLQRILLIVLALAGTVK